MWKRKVENNLIGGILNFESLIRDLRNEKLTGFVKVEGWNFTDYIVFYAGKPLRVVRKKDNKKEFLGFTGYTLSPDTKLSIYESSPLLTAHLSKVLSFPEFQTLIFSGYGDEVFFSQLDIIDFKKFKEFLKKSNFIGYFTLYTPVKVLGNFFCLYGDIVGVNHGTLWDKEAFEELQNYGENCFISTYHIPPEEVQLLISVRGGIKQERNSTGFIISEEGTVQLLHEGLILKSLKITDEEISEKNLSGRIEGTFYSVKFEEDLSPLELDLELLHGEVEKGYVESGTLNKVKELFVDYMGPIGGVLFKKILGEYSSDFERIPKRSFKSFLKRLEEEIPEENLKEEFRKKLEEVINK